MSQPVNEQQLEKNLFDAIFSRHSVRAYAPVDLDQKTVQTLLTAAVRAPTAMHEEPWEFVVVQNRQTLKQLSDLAKPVFLDHLSRGGHAFDKFASPDFNIFYDAGTLILIGARRSGPVIDADCWLAAENLMLAACALGLGSCVIGSSIEALNTPEAKEILGAPADFCTVAPIIVGVAKEETPATSRKDPVIISWE